MQDHLTWSKPGAFGGPGKLHSSVGNPVLPTDLLMWPKIAGELT